MLNLINEDFNMSDKTKEEIESQEANAGEENSLSIPNKPTASPIKNIQLAALSKLNEWQLADEFDRLEGDYQLVKWRIASLIKEKFKSSTLYGQFLQELRDKCPDHPLCMIGTATLRRYYKADKTCIQLNIENLKTVGLSPTIIYELGELKSKEKLEEIYNKIKNENAVTGTPKRKKKGDILASFQKNATVEDVKNLIKQADSIEGVIIPHSEGMVNDVIDEQKNKDEIVEKVLEFINSFAISVSDKRSVLESVLEKL